MRIRACRRRCAWMFATPNPASFANPPRSVMWLYSRSNSSKRARTSRSGSGTAIPDAASTAITNASGWPIDVSPVICSASSIACSPARQRGRRFEKRRRLRDMPRGQGDGRRAGADASRTSCARSTSRALVPGFPSLSSPAQGRRGIHQHRADRSGGKRNDCAHSECEHERHHGTVWRLIRPVRMVNRRNRKVLTAMTRCRSGNRNPADSCLPSSPGDRGSLPDSTPASA